MSPRKKSRRVKVKKAWTVPVKLKDVLTQAEYDHLVNHLMEQMTNEFLPRVMDLLAEGKRTRH